MPVSLTCSGCKSTLKVRDDLAGKKVKCPKCATLLTVPAAEEEEFAPVEIDDPSDSVVDAPPPEKKSKPSRDDDDEDDRPRGKSRRRDEDDEDDDRDRKRNPDRDKKGSTGIRADRDRGRRDDDDEDDGRDRKRRRGRGRDDDDDDRIVKKSKYEPCPRCEATGATKVKWTPWGSFYGPAMFTHVRCPECGYAYNGKTGGSNLIPAIIFVTVPTVGILGILGFLAYFLYTYYKATQI
jgi:hypothetical protein